MFQPLSGAVDGVTGDAQTPVADGGGEGGVPPESPMVETADEHEEVTSSSGGEHESGCCCCCCSGHGEGHGEGEASGEGSHTPQDGEVYRDQQGTDPTATQGDYVGVYVDHGEGISRYGITRPASEVQEENDGDPARTSADWDKAYGDAGKKQEINSATAEPSPTEPPPSYVLRPRIRRDLERIKDRFSLVPGTNGCLFDIPAKWCPVGPEGVDPEPIRELAIDPKTGYPIDPETGETIKLLWPVRIYRIPRPGKNDGLDDMSSNPNATSDWYVLIEGKPWRLNQEEVEALYNSNNRTFLGGLFAHTLGFQKMYDNVRRTIENEAQLYRNHQRQRITGDRGELAYLPDRAGEIIRQEQFNTFAPVNRGVNSWLLIYSGVTVARGAVIANGAREATLVDDAMRAGGYLDDGGRLASKVGEELADKGSAVSEGFGIQRSNAQLVQDIADRAAAWGN
jgi:hypothetical protein